MSRGSRVRSPPGVVHGACSVMVIIGASQALDPGSIPGRRIAAFWGISSIGRVRALQARGTGIETPMLQFSPARSDFYHRPRRRHRTPSLDGRAVQGARLKFESLRRRGFESHSKQPPHPFCFVPTPSPVPARGAGPTCTGHWSSGMILL